MQVRQVRWYVIATYQERFERDRDAAHRVAVDLVIGRYSGDVVFLYFTYIQTNHYNITTTSANIMVKAF